MFKNIGVIGDIHAESTRLKTALEFLQSQELDAILCVGDIVDGTGDVDMCCELLEHYQVITVKGNHDEWFLFNKLRDLPDATQLQEVSRESEQFIEKLQPVGEFATYGGNLLLCHGLGKKTMGKVRDDDFGYALKSNIELQNLINSGKYRFVINGHTHIKMIRHFEGMTIINAGSLLYDDAIIMTINFEKRHLRYYPIGTSVSTRYEDHIF